MTDHSPEPWRTDGANDNIKDADDSIVCTRAFGRTGSNLLRIIACVNALKGVPTEALVRIADRQHQIWMLEEHSRDDLFVLLLNRPDKTTAEKAKSPPDAPGASPTVRAQRE